MLKTVKKLLEEYKASEGVKVCPKALPEEQETIINHDPDSSLWSIYTTEPEVIKEAVRESYLTEIIEVYYSGKSGTVITSLEGVLLRAPSLYSAL